MAAVEKDVRADGGDSGLDASSFVRKRSLVASEDGESGDSCRICRGEGTDEQPLFYPCKCSGSIKFVHQECLMEWLSHSQKKYCELCKTSFRFTKLYDQAMPERLPFPLFLRQVALHGAHTLAKWMRYVLVTFIWTCWLPWSIRQIWRGSFWLADGSWMSQEDARRLATDSKLTLSNTTAEVAIQTLAGIVGVTDSVTVETTQSEPSATFFDFMSGDALLKGLLRLISYKTRGSAPASVKTQTSSSASFFSISGQRRPSLLSELSSLKSFTRYPMLNNALVDILEGQLVCLSVIAAFILVFLIREWVINQQPVHMMPDPDQGDVPAPAQANQEDNGRPAAGRRRRLAIRRVREQDEQAEIRPFDAARRPIALPRPRRAVTDDNVVLRQRDATTGDRRELSRSGSLEPTTSLAQQRASTSHFDTVPSGSTPPITTLQNYRSPPLQRGILDEVVDIRRNIEEGTDHNREQSNQDPNSSSSPSTLIAGTVDDSRSPPAYAVENDSMAFGASQPFQPQFTFSSPSNITEIIADIPSDQTSDTQFPVQRDEASAHPDYLTVNDSSQETVDALWEDISSEIMQPEQNDTGEQEVLPGTPQPTNPAPERNDGSQTVPNNAAPQGMFDKIAAWLWHTDLYDPTEGLAPARDDAHIIRDINAEAPFVPVHPQDPATPPAAPPAPAHEPNMQFGIDLNDPNAMDDAEDLEGILELIGMEGPIAGMIQNIIFSMFLITLTLSASVWCPYIWGKIALLILSSPIGVFLKAPLLFVSRFAEVLVDLILIVLCIFGYTLMNSIKVIKTILAPLLPTLDGFIRFGAIETLAISVSQKSSARLEKVLSVTVFNLRPDLPTFSMQSHHALRVFKKAFSEIIAMVTADVFDTVTTGEAMWKSRGILAIPLFLVKEIASFPGAILSALGKSASWFRALSNDLSMPSLDDPDTIDYSLIEWSTRDRILVVIAGYIFFAMAGFAYLKVAHLVSGLKPEDKVDGIFADSLRQAGGVLKVIVIIGIEMIVFPLYCGCLLDIALLPLFRDATISSRLSFIANAPITGIFVHWFLGTCYMFHFALFVSMCRKILRKGVLYFIRDPDDPTFHPVRDVLERSVATQLGKIGFSAGVYGGLVIVCLGSVVWSLSRFGNVFPIEWTTNEPRLAFPVDIIFFNFILPFLIRRTEPSKKVSAVYEWWFRACARKLRLSHFLFGDMLEEETRPFSSPSPASTDSKPVTEAKSSVKSTDGMWVRAPASDSVRMPRGTKVFLEVNEDNERTDGRPDKEKGLHGKDDERFAKIFIPPSFRIRITLFVFLVWLFAACTGVALTVGPLSVGRAVIRALAGTALAPNDLYAFTVGMHICGVIAYTSLTAVKHRTFLKEKSLGVLLNVRENMPRLYRSAQYALGLLYMTAAFGVVIPILLSLLAELYIHMPIYGFVTASSVRATSKTSPTTEASKAASVPTIYIVQAWTLGILYLRLLIRVALNYPNSDTRAATALKSIVRHGLLHPDIRLATRALILPIVTVSSILLTLPLGIAKTYLLAKGISDHERATTIYRSCYPILLIIVLDVYVLIRVHKKIEGWQIKVRDEVYLVGERLHNFTDPDTEVKKGKKDVARDEKGKGIARTEEGAGGEEMSSTEARSADTHTAAETVAGR